MRYSSFERPLTLFDMVGALFRYKWRVVLVTCLMLIVSVTAIFLFPKKYESEAKLFVRLGRGSASLDPATIGQTISIQESRESEMNSIVDMLQSRGLAEQVVQQIGAERILQKYAWIEVQAETLGDQAMELLADKLPALAESTDADGELSAEEINARERSELAVKELQSNLKIDSPRKSTTIGIAFRGRTPELAQDVVRSVIDCYQQMHIDAYQSGGALEFFDEQFETQEQLVSESENTLRQAKNEFAIVTMKGKQESLQTEITDVKKMQLQTQAELQAAQARVEKLQKDLDELPKDMISSTTTGIAVNATDAMRDRLYALEIQEKDLASKYAATHPELIKVREQLRSAREIMDQQPSQREQSVRAVNPIHLQIENEMLLAEASRASLQAKSEALGKIEAGLMERLSAVNDLEVMSEELQRKIDIARNNHRSYAKKLEESRIHAALDQESLSNVSVVSAPSIRYKHASPRRSILVVLAGIFSLMCGMAVALISDYSANAREIHLIRDAERQRYLRQLKQESLEMESLKLEPPLRVTVEPASEEAEPEPEPQELQTPNKAK